jgi:TRAP-type mannitol/chloroaromatic compound transport system substrate-binding protein
VGSDWKLHWILIVTPPYYKNITNDGTSESHARKKETGSLAFQMDIHQAKADANQVMLTKMGANRAEMLARMEAKTDINLKEMKEEIINQAKADPTLKETKELTRLEAKIEAEIKANNDKFQVKVISSLAWIPTKPGH